jgi:hypothetical protein
VINCEVVITAIDANNSRVVPDCGAAMYSQIQAPVFEEHIAATLNKRAFSWDTVDRRRSEVAVSNLGEMRRNIGEIQREALRRADEFQRMEAESR